MLEAGMQAPAFTLADKDGNMVPLSDFLGKKVILYFYPKATRPDERGRHVCLRQRTTNLKEKCSRHRYQQRQVLLRTKNLGLCLKVQFCK